MHFYAVETMKELRSLPMPRRIKPIRVSNDSQTSDGESDSGRGDTIPLMKNVMPSDDEERKEEMKKRGLGFGFGNENVTSGSEYGPSNSFSFLLLENFCRSFSRSTIIFATTRNIFATTCHILISKSKAKSAFLHFFFPFFIIRRHHIIHKWKFITSATITLSVKCLTVMRNLDWLDLARHFL